MLVFTQFQPVVDTLLQVKALLGHATRHDALGQLNCAMLTALRRASSDMSTLACIASASVARLYTSAIACP
jgi:hypothetical protein